MTEVCMLHALSYAGLTAVSTEVVPVLVCGLSASCLARSLMQSEVVFWLQTPVSRCLLYTLRSSVCARVHPTHQHPRCFYTF